MLREGENVGPYRIVEALGSGGMAAVYKAYHAKLDRYVAIKMIHESLQQEGNFMARFEREAQIIAKLEHPNIVPVYDFSEYEGKPYLVMKFVQGRTLGELLEDGPLSLAEILRIMTAIADALTYAHEQGVLHRDIKPSNIILDERNVPYLTDFGLARLVRQGATSLSQGAMIGTPYYISPEQALGQSELDPRTDIYSLGVVLYQLVVGRVPFEGDTPFSIVHDHIYTPLPSPRSINPEVPPAVENVLVKALAKDPDARYETARAMMDAFRQAVQEAGLVRLSPGRDHGAAESLAEPPRQKAADGPALRVPPPPSPPEVGEWGEKLGQALKNIDLSDVENLGPRIEAAINRFVAAGQAGQEEGPLTPEEKLRQQIEERIEKRQEFITHLGIYITTNVFLWVLWALAGSLLGGICTWPWVLVIMLGWGIGIVAHFLEYYTKYGPGAAQREHEIQRELRRELRRELEQDRLRGELVDEDDAAYAKRKREELEERRVRLTDDGELSESFVQELEDREKPKREGRQAGSGG